MILAGDIGGTKVNLGLFRPGPGRPETVRKQEFKSRDWPGLSPLIAEFLEPETAPVEAAAFGIAGPVIGQRVRTPNLPWEIDREDVARAAGTMRVQLLNDLEATAEGIPALDEEEVETLAAGESDGTGNAALIAPGTGLGMCMVARPEGHWIPLAGEGGHQSFAPENEEEEGLRRFLADRYGHVSVERVVSGPGLVNVFDYFVAVHGMAPSASLAGDMKAGDAAAAISKAAMEGTSEVAVRALEVFLHVFGSVAGNFALATLARAGVWLGGGIPPKLLTSLLHGPFLEGFRAKGRFRGLVTRIPVRVVLNDETALLGAAVRAAAVAQGR